MSRLRDERSTHENWAETDEDDNFTCCAESVCEEDMRRGVWPKEKECERKKEVNDERNEQRGIERRRQIGRDRGREEREETNKRQARYRDRQR